MGFEIHQYIDVFEDERRWKRNEIGLKCCIATEDTEIGKKLSALLYAVSEAIEKHYLRDFFILVSTDEADNTDEVVEAYTLTFTYADGGGLLVRSPSHEIAVSCESVFQLREEVITLLERLNVLMSALSPIPQSAFPYFKLTYYSSTPNNYEPVGFKSSPTTYHFKKMTSISEIAGTFSTKFESCSVCLESVFFENANEQYEQNTSVEMGKLQMRKRITDETPTGRPRKDRIIVCKEKKPKYDGKTKGRKSKKIMESEDNRSESMNLRISSLETQMVVTDDVSEGNSTEIIESIRASLLEGDSPNESGEVGQVVLSSADAVVSTTDLQKGDFSSEYPGDSEEVPESSGQFATFGSPSGPYINSPRMDSTVSLPTVTELVHREPTFKKDSSPSSGISIITESDITKELFTRRSSNVGTSANAEPKAKKMKISRSKVDYHKVIISIISPRNLH
uniref:HORMA domain-containing protein n=1 Tax=Elaeophora elaphi TaxID=1147741 RepID=A0A158Q756_9BILA